MLTDLLSGYNTTRKHISKKLTSRLDQMSLFVDTFVLDPFIIVSFPCFLSPLCFLRERSYETSKGRDSYDNIS